MTKVKMDRWGGWHQSIPGIKGWWMVDRHKEPWTPGYSADVDVDISNIYACFCACMNINVLINKLILHEDENNRKMK